MIRLNIEADIRRVDKYLTALERQEVPKATNSALNRAIRKANTVAARNISKEAGIKPQRKVREQLRIVKSNWKRLEAVLIARGRAFNLIQFVTASKRKVGAFRRKTGVQAKAWGQKKTYQGTFIGRGTSSGKLLVFRRTGPNRTPIKAVHGPSVPIEFQRRKVEEAMKTEGLRTFRKEFFRDLRRRLARLERRTRAGGR